MAMVAVVAALALDGAEKPEPHAAADRARTEFENAHGWGFWGTVAVDWRVAEDELRYDRAPGRAVWRFALPYDSDSRLRFVDAGFDGGRFLAATNRTFGLAPQILDEKGFCGLRARFPMVATRLGSRSYMGRKIAFYPPRALPSSVALSAVGYGRIDNPARSRHVGALSVRRLGSDLGKLAYRTTLRTKDGLSIDLGTSGDVGSKELFKAMRRALEGLGRGPVESFSERELVDLWEGGTLVYEAVKGQ